MAYSNMATRKRENAIPVSSLPAVLFLVSAYLSQDETLLPTSISITIVIASVLLAFIAIIADPLNRQVNIISYLIIATGSYMFDIAPLWASVALAVATISALIVTVKIQRENKPRLLKDLERFTPEAVRDEEELEKQLYQYLKAKGYRVTRQPRLPQGLRADLKVDECIIELKILRTREQAQRLIGQIQDYRKYNKCL